jgi:ABC-type sulfate transport system permease component
MAHVAFTYPLVVRNVAGAIEEIDPSYEETARTLGAKPIQAFRRVLYPMIKSSILAGSIMAFTRSLGETGATQAVVSEALTAPVYIVELVKGQEYYLAGLACIALISVSYAAMLLLRYLTRKKGRSV